MTRFPLREQLKFGEAFGCFSAWKIYTPGEEQKRAAGYACVPSVIASLFFGSYF